MSNSTDNDHTISLREAAEDGASSSAASSGAEGPGADAPKSSMGTPRPDALTLGPVDSPRFAVPPFASSGRPPVSRRDKKDPSSDDPSPEDPDLDGISSEPHGDGSAAPEPGLDGASGEGPPVEG